jgi:molybdopterin/thiamine biosynthesis adenylyltransferase/rhodanese-related sulfurtransferase
MDQDLPDPMPMEVDLEQVAAWLDGNIAPLTVDVRELQELVTGLLPGAHHVPLVQLPRKASQLFEKDAPVVIYCQKGIRSAEAVGWLREQGWSRCTSLRGGFEAWLQAELPVVPGTEGGNLDASDRIRYARHLTIPQVGVEGQERLLAGSVLLVGGGGLGCPAGLYLAAAGVGKITIADDDVVEASNLQRQVLYRTCEIGESKAVAAARTLKALNPGIEIEALPERVVESNVDDLVSAHDVVLDGADNFNTRFLINDTCVKHGVPVVHGSVYRFEGQVTVFDPAHSGPCLRCLHPVTPAEGSCASCAEAGVLGVIPGIVGTIQAAETIKLLLGIGSVLRGRLLLIDAMDTSFREIEIPVRSDCTHCK